MPGEQRIEFVDPESDPPLPTTVPPPTTATPPTSVAPAARLVAVPALAADGATCVRPGAGRMLVLGARVRNVSAADIVIDRVGLRVASASATGVGFSCGTATRFDADHTTHARVRPGEDVWLAAVVRERSLCATPDPVLFDVRVRYRGRTLTIEAIGAVPMPAEPVASCR